ncbi:MAG: thymidylate kinase [Ruminococcaceae bacterium]|nr:thymidylate kinase [Oscillospiraceae bacterium]
MGRFIVIEGLDGSGKTTQGKLLAERLRREGKKVRELSFPCYGEKSATLVEMYLGGLLGESPSDTNGYAASVFYAADRYISYVTDWKKDIEDGECIVLATRYTTANAYHQLSKLPREEWEGFLSWLYDFEFSKIGLPRPDSVVLLSMNQEISSKNVKDRSAETGQMIDIHEKDRDYLLRCAEAALFAAEKDGWHVIECAPDGILLPIEEINDKIKEAIK